MVYRGYVKNGVVVLEGSVALPEGLEVRVELPSHAPAEATREENRQTLGQRLLKHAGKAVGLPVDAARNHDHHLYGSPRQ
jgi:hypothetical protein